MLRVGLVGALVGLLAWFGWAAQNTTTSGAVGTVATAPDDVPARTFEAYLRAVEQADPACGLRWEVLAGFGAIESSHGTYDGDGITRTVRPDGVITPGIVGPALDGGAFALVWDTDGGRLDGDPVYDRAVGPTQFIPSTWAGVMGDGFDPQNVDHAALATARKVCHDAGGPVLEPANLTRAAYRYNPSDEYVHAVVERVEHYMLWSATNPGQAQAAVATKVDEPTLTDVMATMGASGRRRWLAVGETLSRDGDDGVLDGVYGWTTPAVDAVLGGLEGDQAGEIPPPAKVSQAGAKIAAAAQAWVGEQYRPGVREQCAFFVRQVLDDAGVDVGVTGQPLDGELPTGPGMANSFGPEQGAVIRTVGELQPGDIVMFEGTYGPASWADSITHVAIYMGDGMIVDRPTASAPVRHRPVSTFEKFAGAIRVGG